MIFSKPSGDATKRYKERRVLALIPFLTCMVAVVAMKMTESFATSSERGWATTRIMILASAGVALLIFIVDISATLYNFSSVKRRVGENPVYCVGIAIADWNQNHFGTREAFDHLNFLPYTFLIVSEQALEFRTGYSGDTEVKLSIPYKVIEEIEVVRVSSVMSTGPGLRIDTQENNLDLQLFPLLSFGSIHSTKRTAKRVAEQIRGRLNEAT
ncbi:hypothetical protein QBL02_13760 [Leucobacter sp. UT-8R-CII-1-4]|uniref:hypothetical protein n=1 Tax=Leucobacter sp. UT-8R-CII-1-4 TaxID=3040075 RepID=UPI0024A9DEDF|nr:hypothetical protein [Leucobacter sp. UT-8R-CII-1-4]MDI6024603.1 hypothetical protein [Leucobacter sp. UT-8R-CII-1-4]